MRSRLPILLLLASAIPVFAQVRPDDSAAQRKADEQFLRESGISLDSSGVLKVFQDRTLSKEEEGRLGKLAANLGHPSYAAREKAALQLQRAGRLAFKVLQNAQSSHDAEVVRRAELILREINLNSDAPLLQAAARQVGRSSPPQAAETLLAYIPFASSNEVLAELRNALTAILVRAGQPVPVMVAALTDRNPLVRSAAGQALSRARVNHQREAVASLLQDPDMNVRLEVALAMIQAHDKRGVPTLVDLVAKLQGGPAWQAEDTLRQIAGEKAPAASLGLNKPKEVHAGWLRWWKQEEKGLDLSKLDEVTRLLGYTLITQMNTRAGAGGLQGSVYELGPDGKERWRINNVRYPLDAAVVGPDRVLVAEYLNRAVTERDFKGQVLWSHQINNPITAQRLPGGRTFIASRQQLLIVTRDGKQEFSFTCPQTISAARWLPGGQMICINSAGLLQRLDAQGKTINQFQAGQVYTTGGNIDVLPGSRILVPIYRTNKVVEYTLEGKQVWQANVTWPTSAVRLPNGNTLVVSMTQQRVVELNRDGKEVWSHRTDGRPWRARRR